MKIKIKGTKNVRDLGGLRSEDGRVIASHRLIRSGHLAKLKKSGAEKLSEDLNLHTVVDFRNDTERTEKPDRIPEGVGYIPLTVLDEDHNPPVNRKTRLGVLKKVVRAGGGIKYLENSYRMMVTDPGPLEAYREFIQAVRNECEGGAVLWHCTQGKDRAGVGTVVLLLALGIDRAAIMADYLLTNRTDRIRNKIYTLLVCLRSHSIKIAHAFVDVMSARKEYLESVFRAVDEEWGGTDEFLENGLNLSEDYIDDLRDALLLDSGSYKAV